MHKPILRQALHSSKQINIITSLVSQKYQNIAKKNQNCEIDKLFAVMSNAWLDETNHDDIQDCDKKFEDNFVVGASKSKEFQKLDDSEEYLSKLGEFADDCINSVSIIADNLHHPTRISLAKAQIQIFRAQAIAR